MAASGASKYIYSNVVKKTFHIKAVFVLNLIINISGYLQTDFTKGSIIDVWGGPECASECNNIKSYEVTAESVQKNRNCHTLEYPR